MFRRMKTLAAALAALCAVGGAANAHEFWIEPVATRVAVGEPLVARTFIGTYFQGEELANYPSMQVVFDVSLGVQIQPVGGEVGAVPAIDVPFLGEGLHVMRYQSRDFQLTYESYDDFLAFLAEADRMDLARTHDERGLPRENIREVYFRYAKSLVAVGNGAGSDQFMGMPWELVALTNPYTAAPGAPMRFELLFRNDPLPDAAVHVFIRAEDGTISDVRLRSDADGVATVPSEVKGLYMVNAIRVMPASERMQFMLGASWQSLWASSTYAIE